eukprot:scaffold281185_cov49-Prasinocladus_malaysianus.AAC.1
MHPCNALSSADIHPLSISVHSHIALSACLARRLGPIFFAHFLVPLSVGDTYCLFGAAGWSPRSFDHDPILMARRITYVL